MPQFNPNQREFTAEEWATFYSHRFGGNAWNYLEKCMNITPEKEQEIFKKIPWLRQHLNTIKYGPVDIEDI
jgi:hypothetical protein